MAGVNDLVYRLLDLTESDWFTDLPQQRVDCNRVLAPLPAIEEPSRDNPETPLAYVQWVDL